MRPSVSWLRWRTLLPLLCLLGVAGLLGARCLASTDLGYHLADAERSLAEGWPVDRAPHVWGVRGTDGPLAPGGWLDAEGRLHQVNTSWLSQLALLLAWRIGDGLALWSLQVLLVLALTGLVVLAGRRAGLSPGWACLAALLVLLCGFERFELRPGLLARVVLAGQLALLAPALVGRRRVQRGELLGTLVLQVLAVNLHGSFLLGIGLGAAVLVGALRRGRGIRPSAGLCAGLLAASFLHPAGWRGALLPLETLLFLAREEIGRSAHPWSAIGEFRPPFDEAFAASWATPVFGALLLLAALALLLAAFRGRWGSAAVLLGALGVGLSMRRSLLVAALLAAPIAFQQLSLSVRAWGVRSDGRWLGPLAGLGSLTVAAALLGGVFFSAAQPWSLAPGLSRFDLPLGAAGQLAARKLQGRLFSDFDSSSNLHWFVPWRPAVPVLTNTFVYPPAHLARHFALLRGELDFAQETAGDSIGVAVLSSNSAPLFRALAADPAWATVHLGPRHAVFVRRDGPDAAWADEALDAERFPLAAYRDELLATGSSPVAALVQGGQNLERLRWYLPASELLEEAVRLDPDHPSAWGLLGAVRAARGMRRLLDGETAGRDDWLAARRALRRAVELGDLQAGHNLHFLDRQLDALRQGVLLTPADMHPEETP